MAQQLDYPTQVKRPPMLDPRGYNWSRTSGLGASGSLSSAGSNAIVLTPCPSGVTSFMANLASIYVSGGVGTAEAALITAFASTASNCTITITTANTHTGSWVVQSSSDGIQEAIIAAGYYGGVNLGCVAYNIRATIQSRYRVSIKGCGMDATYLNNQSATTGVLNYTALTIPGDGDTFGGVEISGFTIVAGLLSSTSTNASVSDAIYLLGAGWNVVIKDVFIRNHTTGLHQVNGWYSKWDGGGCRHFRDDCVYTETNGNLGTGTQAGLGQGAGQKLYGLNISNVGSTGPQSSTGCAVRYANWSGIEIDGMDVTATNRGLCFQPRAATGVETFTFVYYGMISNSAFDTTALGGILFDSTNATNGSISTLKFTNVISAFNGCISNCTAAPFTNPAPGIEFIGATNKPIKDITFIGGTTRENGGHGVVTNDTAYVNNVTFIGMTADTNSQAATNTYDGYHFGNGNFQITIQGVTSGVINSTLSRAPRYGLFLGSAITQALITGNTFYPSNATGPCSSSSSSLLNNISMNLPSTDATCNSTFSVQPLGLGLGYDFASLPTSPNGTVLYCNNCNSTCTASGGTGRTCFRENGAWTH